VFFITSYLYHTLTCLLLVYLNRYCLHTVHNKIRLCMSHCNKLIFILSIIVLWAYNYIEKCILWHLRKFLSSKGNLKKKVGNHCCRGGTIGPLVVAVQRHSLTSVDMNKNAHVRTSTMLVALMTEKLKTYGEFSNGTLFVLPTFTQIWWYLTVELTDVRLTQLN
jgi:hypothetical protein